MPRFFFHSQFRSVLIISFLFLLLINIPLIPMLTLMNGKTGLITYQVPITTNEEFSIRYIHSIHKTPVEEFFYIDRSYNIVADKTTFESYGVGIPSNIENGQTFKIEDGKFEIDHINRVLPYFDQRIGQVIANHQLIIKGKDIPLNKLVKPGNWIRFQASKRSIIQFLRGGTWYER